MFCKEDDEHEEKDEETGQNEDVTLSNLFQNTQSDSKRCSLWFQFHSNDICDMSKQ